MKINTLFNNSANYPKQLSAIYSPPKQLYYSGVALDTSITYLAVVGTRRPSIYGKTCLHTIMSGLRGAPLGIVSGLALGIDALAHKEAIQNNLYTVAVLPSGLNTIYPRTNKPLAENILKHSGTLISEYPIHQLPQKYHFLERNRIIAGLSNAVLIIEAASRSGTLSTAHHAINEGREVMVVPGPINSPLSEGTNSLLKAGAHAVTCAEDILHILAIQTDTTSVSYVPQNASEKAILDAIKSGISYESDIQVCTKLSYQDFAQTLTQLELLGIVTQVGGGNYCLN